jgi:DNA-binding transcriptional LysR family regulator
LRCSDKAFLVCLQIAALEPFHDLELHEFPFPQPRMEALMLWHEITNTDPANQWLRKTIQSLFDDMADEWPF